MTKEYLIHAIYCGASVFLELNTSRTCPFADKQLGFKALTDPVFLSPGRCPTWPSCDSLENPELLLSTSNKQHAIF